MGRPLPSDRPLATDSRMQRGTHIVLRGRPDGLVPLQRGNARSDIEGPDHFNYSFRTIPDRSAFVPFVVSSTHDSAKSMNPTIYVVDDDEAVRESLKAMLVAEGFAVQVFESAARFLAKGDINGGCLVVDVAMPGMTGIELQSELNRQSATIPLVVITGNGDVPLAVRAMAAGAVDFIEKPFDGAHLLSSVSRALRVGEKTRSRAEEAAAARTLLDLLTPRERDVVDGMVNGFPNKLIAHELGISPRTVEIHRANLMEKLQVRGLSDIVRLVLAASPPDTGRGLSESRSQLP